jgi:hypothetical protein
MWGGLSFARRLSGDDLALLGNDIGRDFVRAHCQRTARSLVHGEIAAEIAVAALVFDEHADALTGGCR